MAWSGAPRDLRTRRLQRFQVGEERLLQGLEAPPGAGGVYSFAEGAAFLLVALPVQEGVLGLDRAVAHYWPEFAAGGRAGITLRGLLTHRAGLVGVDGGFTIDELADDRLIAGRMAGHTDKALPGLAYIAACSA